MRGTREAISTTLTGHARATTRTRASVHILAHEYFLRANPDSFCPSDDVNDRQKSPPMMNETHGSSAFYLSPSHIPAMTHTHNNQSKI